MVGFVTTPITGVPVITNTSPSQSVITDTPGSTCLGEVAVTNAGTTTTIELSTLPVASTFTQENAVQTLTQTGEPVVYSPITLSGYDNPEPIEISTGFVETLNGQTTTQWGWWLIGPHGRIDPPVNRPWRRGSGSFGCIGGPLLCDAPCGDLDVGLGWFISIISASCSPGITGPPGWPGGPIIFGSGLPPDDLPPYPRPDNDPQPDNDNDCEDDGMECSATSVSSQVSSGTASKTPYFLVAAEGAVQTAIEMQLQGYDPENGASFDPDVGVNSVSGGTWIDVNLTEADAQELGSQSDIALIMTCGSLSLFPPDPTSSVYVGTAVSFTTLSATPTNLVALKNRRNEIDGQAFSVASADDSEARFHNRNMGLVKKDEAGSRFRSSVHRNDSRTRDDLQRRDAGTRLVRQLRGPTLPDIYPQDLAVLAWPPGVQTVAGIDYIFEETKGENTWVYMVDSGVSTSHWVRLGVHQ